MKLAHLLFPVICLLSLSAINKVQGQTTINLAEQCQCDTAYVLNDSLIVIGTDTLHIADHDWYVTGTTQIPDDILQDIMTGGSVSIGDTAETRANGMYSLAFGDSAVANGNQSLAGGRFTVAGGDASVALGVRNTTSDDHATISGGEGNSIADNHGAIGGGRDNTIQSSSPYSTIAGGQNNNVGPSAPHAVIGGGQNNDVQEDYGTISGGQNNYTAAFWTSIGGGLENYIGSGSDYSTIGGGQRDSIDSRAHRSTIGGGQYNTIGLGGEGTHGFIGGGQNNVINYGYNSTIAGGRDNETTQGNYTTVGGGWNNSITGEAATIIGGRDNTAGGEYSAILGGQDNTTTGGGGSHMVAAGHNNSASGEYSFALGYDNTASHHYSWAIGRSATTTAENQFMARFTTGFRLVTAAEYAEYTGGGAWTFVSDRRLKNSIRDLDYGLDAVMNLKPKTYFLNSDVDQERRSIGLIAQDVQQVIPEVVHRMTGEEYLGIGYTNLIPVLTKAIQELKVEVDDLRYQNAQLQAQLDEMAVLKSQVQAIQQLLIKSQPPEKEVKTDRKQ